MPKFLLTFLLFVATTVGVGQNLSVTSFCLDDTDITANTAGTIVMDQNGNKCALIKIETIHTGFSFDAGILGVVKTVPKTGVIWVYVPGGVKRLSISHQQFGTIHYDLGTSVQAARTYTMVLKAASVTTIVEEQVKMQYLVFKVDPSDALITLESPDKEKMVLQAVDGSVSKYLNFGIYTYTVQAADYHTQTGMIRINDPENKHQLQVELKPAFGFITIPATGTLTEAMVSIDAKSVGKTPISEYKLYSGSHKIIVTRSKYKSLSTDITIEDGEILTFDRQPEPNFASITINGIEGSEIWINGNLAGQSPWSGELEYGPYKVECRKQNHRTSTKSFELTPGFATTITMEAPTPIYGSLNIECIPAISNLYIDGKSYGETPIAINKLPIGNHEIRISKTGYADYVKIVTISENKAEIITATLSSTVTVKLSTTAKKPIITLDGRKIASLSAITFLSIGSHTISISDPECHPFLKDFTVNKNGINTFVFEPERIFADTTIIVKGVIFKMIAVQGGTFYMGATSEQGSDADEDEKPVHSVTLNSFRIGETEVTQELWQVVMGDNPSFNKSNGLSYPVERVSWDDCQLFISKLNQMTGKNFRLPTEAEWEYAARGGNKSKVYKYSGSNDISSIAWYVENSRNSTHAVKTKSPNELGIYDMSGNVWEWCSDWYSGAYASGSVTNPYGPSSGKYLVYRGGSYFDNAIYCRVSNRIRFSQSYRNYDLGLRLTL